MEATGLTQKQLAAIVARAQDILGDERHPDAVDDAVKVICRDYPRDDWPMIRAMIEGAA